MNAYKIFVGIDTRYGDFVGVTFAADANEAQIVADKQVAGNQIAWVRYIGRDVEVDDLEQDETIL